LTVFLNIDALEIRVEYCFNLHLEPIAFKNSLKSILHRNNSVGHVHGACG